VPGIAVLHRPVLSGAAGLTRLRSLHQHGWLTVTEFDDHPDHFPALRGDGQYGFTGVHAVQTTTEPLAAILRARNPEVAVFPNAVRELPEPRNFTDPDSLTLFFGALNREGDWRDLLETVNHVAALAGEKLRFEVVHDRAFFDGLRTARKNFTPTCDHATYLALLGGADICFMPLADTPFNRAKSDLKFIEAASARAVALASPVVYAASIADGETGVIFHDAAELRARLLQLIAFPQMARDIAEAGRDYVRRERMLTGQVAARLAWYRDLWARREELAAALRARVPDCVQ
jgi:glycosyltransferase involved in cell wall biosynthesis